METVQGTILGIDTFPVTAGGRPGVHLRLYRKQDTVAVHLGPLWYLENQEMAFSVRDAKGYPVWSGWRRRNPGGS